MRHDITPEAVAQHIYDRIICPTGDPQKALTEWMDITSGLGCALDNWQRVAVGRHACSRSGAPADRWAAVFAQLLATGRGGSFMTMTGIGAGGGVR